MSGEREQGDNRSSQDLVARQSVLARFRLEDIQNLQRDDLAAAQQLCGHGATLGRWETDSPAMQKTFRSIDLAKRVGDALDKLDPEWQRIGHAVDEQMAEAVLTLTRIGLLLRLAPVGGRKQKTKDRPIKGSSAANFMYQHWPTIMARAILRKTMTGTGDSGFFRHLTADDLTELSQSDYVAIEIKRLFILSDNGYWSDTPARRVLPTVTNPSSKPAARKPEKKSVPHPPFPLDWLSEIGPRVLWVVTELAPNLLRLLEQLREPLKDERLWATMRAPGELVSKIIVEAMAREPWVDRAGKPLVPPFRLKTSSTFKADRFEWPVRTWDNILTLSGLVQAAHGFIALLACAGRIGEVSTLQRSCIEVHADGAAHSRGKTYKLNWSPAGMSRTWPAPAMLVQALGQQARFAALWDWLPISLTMSCVPTEPQFGGRLWVSIGSGGNIGPGADLHWGTALVSLAMRLGVDTKPGGKAPHPHRFRKTVAKLAGIALWNSPLVLKQLLGHKSIEKTLHYILSDPSIREEAEKVLRELRVLHCAETLQEVREAMKAGLQNPFGGVGGARLAIAVSEHENRETQSGRVVTKESLQELATQYTMNGMGWRRGIGFICSKLPHESGECRAGSSRHGERGAPLISNCKANCPQRIELAAKIDQARQARDVEEICEAYIDTATKACEEGQLLVAAHCLKQMDLELANWPDLKARYETRPEMQAIVAAIGVEVEAEAEAANG